MLRSTEGQLRVVSPFLGEIPPTMMKEGSRQSRGYLVQGFIRSCKELSASGNTTPESLRDSRSILLRGRNNRGVQPSTKEGIKGSNQ